MIESANPGREEGNSDYVQTDFSHLDVREEGGTFYVTLNRPDKRNQLTDVVIDELLLAVGRSSDLNCRALVLRGAGGVFSAGGDLRHIASVAEDADRDRVVEMNRRYGALLELVLSLESTVVAVVEGAAIAGGLGLVCVADVVIAQPSARFALTEATLGLVPGQVAPVLARRIGVGPTRRLSLTAARFDAREAAGLGLVDYVSDDVDHVLDEVLIRIMMCAPQASAAIKALLEETRDLPLSHALDIASEVFADSLLGSEARHGIDSFLAKQRPSWAPPVTR